MENHLFSNARPHEWLLRSFFLAQPSTEGYIAVILPKFEESKSITEGLLTREQYEEVLMKRNQQEEPCWDQLALWSCWLRSLLWRKIASSRWDENVNGIMTVCHFHLKKKKNILKKKMTTWRNKDLSAGSRTVLDFTGLHFVRPLFMRCIKMPLSWLLFSV